MKFFLDTNVLFDLFISEREQHTGSNALAKAAIRGNVHAVISATSVLTVLYSLRKYGLKMDMVVARLSALLPHLTIAHIGQAELLAGINSGWKDLEDAVQFQAALKAGGIDAIVSNDKDFKQQDMIPVITPAQALKRLK